MIPAEMLACPVSHLLDSEMPSLNHMQRAAYDPSPVQQRKASIRKSLFSGEGGNTKEKEALQSEKLIFRRERQTKLHSQNQIFRKGKTTSR